LGGSYYTEKTGGRLISIHSLTSRPDTVDAAFLRSSEDNGREPGFSADLLLQRIALT